MGKKFNWMGIVVIVFAVLLITMTAIHLTGMGNEFPNPVGNALNRILSPVEEIVWNIGEGVKKNARAIFSFRRVLAENEELRKQNEQLIHDNLRLKEQVLAGLRYNELSQVFNNPTLDQYNKIGASVINRNPSSWYYSIKVNKGSKDGVKINAPVVANLGLVGKVVTVTPTTAEILLITDSEGKVGAMVRDNLGKPLYGVLSGTYGDTRLEGRGTLEIPFLQEDEVNEGDLVFTSGLGGVFPKEIPIGVVTAIRVDDSGIQKIASVDPIVDFDALEEVYIIDVPGESQ